jgi:diguanylate cyclase (GGDEF)-like protein
MDEQEKTSNLEFSLNMSRHLAALSAALIYSMIYIFLYYKEYTRFTSDEFIMVMSVYWLGNLLFTIFLVSGLNRYLRDGSMSLFQLVWAIIFTLIGIYYLNELRDIILMFYFAAISFGFFRFRTYQFVFCGALAVIGYLFVIILLYINQPLRLIYSQEMLRFFSFTVTTLVIMYTGSAISRLRQEVKQKNIDLAEAVELNTRLATTDDLTGLYTRRYFMEVLDQQKALSERDGSDFVICFADLDHFKHVNDSFGHHVGDMVLLQFSEIIKNSIREIDYAARFGGEEFVLLLVNSDIEKSLNVSERIRKALEEYNFSDIAPALNVTVSIGLANYKQYNSLQETLMTADNRMYKAKEMGRNKVVSG